MGDSDVAPRRLSSAVVVISYVITIPAIEATQVQATITAQVTALQEDPSSFVTVLDKELEAAGVAKGTYTITSVSFEAVEVVQTTSTTLPGGGDNTTNATTTPTTIKRGITGGSRRTLACGFLTVVALLIPLICM